MELRFTPEEIAFRAEVRAFLRKEIPEHILKKAACNEMFAREDYVTTQGILNKKGWAVPQWPKEWGGQDLSAVKLYILNEELQLAAIPPPFPLNTNMVGPVIATFGTEAQKKRFLPGTANLDIWWCQGFSEPEAGSDLASLKTRAVREGDYYIVNGQKTWTTLAQYADWMFCLVRTDPQARKQEGISFLLFDMKTPGITVRPIITIEGHHEVNEVFLDNVKVPVENLVGKENRGWDCAKFLLANERSNIARIGVSKNRILKIKSLAKQIVVGKGTMWDDMEFRSRLAQIEIELKALEITNMRVIANQAQLAADKPDPATSILKIKGSELQQTATELLLELAGPYGNVGADRMAGNELPDFDWAGDAAASYFNNRKVTIYGGSNEIQHNVVAKAILGL